MIGKSKLQLSVKLLSILFVVLAISLSALFITRNVIKARISERASLSVLSSIEKGIGTITLSSLAPEIEGEDIDWLAIEGLEKILGQKFETTEDLDDANKIAESYKLVAVGTLEIPKISLKLPVLKGTDKVGLRYGAGWFAASAKPGQPGNCLLFGHRMKAKGRLFNRLNDLGKGDAVHLADMDAQLYTYTVVDTIEVLPENLFSELYKHTDGRYLSLVTCTPQGEGTHRLIILCEIQEAI